ncbi:MAG: hypothetical protein WC482_06260 [Candidatus Omnitrophota bacterium]|jgi:hypothetical protein|nr:hypothetical protein [Candidatus Omnitrophota bacterium]
MKSIKTPFKTIWNAVLGISVELALVYVFIFTAFAVCFIWWVLLR